MVEFSEKVYLAKDALLTGSKHILNLFGKQVEDIGIEYKVESGDTPRTLIDKNSEKDIVSIIRSHPYYGNDIINAEEEGISGKSKNRVWYVDPYDGTSNAQIKLPMSTTGIGIYENKRYVASIILNPFEKKLYVAEQDKGAYVMQLELHGNVLVETGIWEQIHTDTKTEKSNIKYAWVDALFNSETSQRKTAWIRQMQEKNMMQNIRMTGSNIDYSTKLAEGRGHFQLTDAVGGYYDLCGACLIEEAGGRIVNINGEFPQPGDKIAVAVANPKDLETVLQITQACYEKYDGFLPSKIIDNENLPNLSSREKSFKYKFLKKPQTVLEAFDYIRRKNIKNVDLQLGIMADDCGVGSSIIYTCYPTFVINSKFFRLKKGRQGPLLLPNKEGRYEMLAVQEATVDEIFKIAEKLNSKGINVTMKNFNIHDMRSISADYFKEQREKLAS